MITILIFVGIVLFFLRKKDYWSAAIVPVIITAILWFMLFGGVLGNIINSNHSMYKSYDWLEASWNIRSVKFDSRVTGSFVIGTGSIDSVDYYYIFTHMGNGQWKKQRVKSIDTVIEETVDQPQLLQYRRTKHCNWYWKYFLGIENFMSIDTIYVLKVPKGSITEEYKL